MMRTKKKKKQKKENEKCVCVREREKGIKRKRKKNAERQRDERASGPEPVGRTSGRYADYTCHSQNRSLATRLLEANSI